MLIETARPRLALINCIVDSLNNTLNDRQITLMEYLNELAIIIESDSLPSDCIVLKNNKHYVLLPKSYNEDDLIEIIARIRLHHITYYQYYNDELKNILDEEVKIFMERYKEASEVCLVGTVL